MHGVELVRNTRSPRSSWIWCWVWHRVYFLSTIVRARHSLISKWAPRQPRRAAERVPSPAKLVLCVKERSHVGHQHHAGPVLGSFDSHGIRPERVTMVARATGRRF